MATTRQAEAPARPERKLSRPEPPIKYNIKPNNIGIVRGQRRVLFRTRPTNTINLENTCFKLSARAPFSASLLAARFSAAPCAHYTRPEPHGAYVREGAHTIFCPLYHAVNNGHLTCIVRRLSIVGARPHHPPVCVINFPVCVCVYYIIFLRPTPPHKIISKITTAPVFQRRKYIGHALSLVLSAGWSKHTHTQYRCICLARLDEFIINCSASGIVSGKWKLLYPTCIEVQWSWFHCD